jgi:excisionase family DNA binding protein
MGRRGGRRPAGFRPVRAVPCGPAVAAFRRHRTGNARDEEPVGGGARPSHVAHLGGHRSVQVSVVEDDERALPPSSIEVPMRKLLTVAEAADLLCFSKVTVYRVVQAGQLPAVRAGRIFRIPEQV